MTEFGLPRRMGALEGFGVAIWLLAALGLRALEPLGLLVGGARIVSYALAVPALAVTIWIAQRLLGFSRAEAFGAVSVMTMVAICLDGIAFGFFPGLYGAGEAHRLGAAGVVLWGGGVGMVLAYLWSRGA
jgi:hypothetical protein